VRERQWFQLIESSRFPDGDVFSGLVMRLADEPGRWWRAGPSMGEDTRRILAERAGFSTSEIDALFACGAAFAEADPAMTLRRPYADRVRTMGFAVADAEASPA
jgi:hypothetical protein